MISHQFRYEIADLQHCEQSARMLAKLLESPIYIGLVGTLGAGKTQWTRFLVQAMGGSDEDIASPTFVLVKRYKTRPLIYHLDLYRVQDEDELLELGIEEMAEEGIMVVEWADRFPDALPKERLMIHLSLDSENRSARIVHVSASGSTPSMIAQSWQKEIQQAAGF